MSCCNCCSQSSSAELEILRRRVALLEAIAFKNNDPKAIGPDAHSKDLIESMIISRLSHNIDFDLCWNSLADRWIVSTNNLYPWQKQNLISAIKDIALNDYPIEFV